MARGRNIALLVLVIIVLIAGASTFYTLSESEQAIITQFGRPIGGAVTKAGLHVKAPFIQKLHRFEKRILNWDSSPDQIPTADKKYIWLDTTARWRIVDPLLYFTSVGNMRGAQTRLDDIVDSAARDIVSRHVLVEAVRNSNDILEVIRQSEDEDSQGSDQTGETSGHVNDPIELGREKLTDMILARASELVPQYGIELIDVKIKRLNYIEDVRKKVYERMDSERQRIASKYRSEGEGEKAQILGMKERELDRIQSEAYRTAQEIRGKADAEATAIYAAAYRKDPEFYSFLKTLDVYRATTSENQRMILTTDADIYRYLGRISGR